MTYENCADELVEKIKLFFPNAKHVADADPTDPKNYEEHGNLSKEFLEAQYYVSMEGAVRIKKIVAERPILTRTLCFLEKIVKTKNSKYEKTLAKPKIFLMNSFIAFEKAQDTVENTPVTLSEKLPNAMETVPLYEDNVISTQVSEMSSPPEQQITMNVEDTNMIERNVIFYREIDESINSNNVDNNNNNYNNDDDYKDDNNSNNNDNDDNDTNNNNDANNNANPNWNVSLECIGPF